VSEKKNVHGKEEVTGRINVIDNLKGQQVEERTLLASQVGLFNPYLATVDKMAGSCHC
jgi:hypothetical protein